MNSDIFTRIRNYVRPHTTYNYSTRLWETTWLGHTKAYDFEGYLVSDTFQDHGYRIVNTFIPGTKSRQFKKRILCQRQYEMDTNVLSDEIWYDAQGKKIAYYSDAQPEATLLVKDSEPEYVTTREAFNEKVSPVLDLIRKRSFVINYNLDEMTHHVYSRLSDFFKTAPSLSVPGKEKQEKAQQTPEATKEVPVKPVVESPVVPEAVKEEPVKKVVAPRPKLTPAERKARWEERLQKREEKHAQLLAMKAKVEASKRMNPERKAERLASLNERLMHNERAQHLLKTRLAALAAAQKRDEWKQIKADRQAVYHALQAKLQQKRREFKATKEVLSKEDLALYRQDFKQSTAEKKQALADYRAAIKSTKLASVETRKLKSTKRQKTIFDLAVIVREKDALERSLKTEMDMFKHADMSNRVEELRFKKRALLNKFKEMTRPRQVVLPQVALMVRPRQPLLPGFQETIEK
ncbi:MAG: hypothetical protein II942_00770 [Alphaproteobacteria bacterium]|nr:hypothetical protein [Alphaproteobacteria bacterium]